MPASANVRRHFLSWDQPLLPQVVALLAGDWTGAGPLDLSRVLVIVPTRQAGRRLREALAAHAARFGTAVFPPRVMMPELLVAPPASPDVAGPLVSHLAWASVFQSIPLEEFRQVFPVDPPARSFSWALRLAYEFSRLQRALAEAALGLADVLGCVGENFPERERWRQLGELELRYHAVLAEFGLRDVQAVRRAQSRAPELPPGVERIVLVGTPDPVAPALTVLAAHATKIPVDIYVFAAAADADAFDPWGRPNATHWADRVLEVPDFEQRVHLCPHPAAEADKIAVAAKAYGEPAGALGVGVADAEVLPLLENALEHSGVTAFNPEGRRRQGDALHQLLTALSALARDASFGVVESLARCPDFLAYLTRHSRGRFSPAAFLRELDALHTRHLPPDLKAARHHAPQSEGLAAVAELREVLTSGDFPENAVAALNLIFRDRRFDLQHPADAQATEAAEAWMSLLRDSESAARQFPEVSTADWWELTLRLYGEAVHYDEKPAQAIELQGWLELLWEDAPHLIVAGLNDGRVPDAIVGDPFLPESLRVQLGLKTNAARFARDAYLLQALATSRQAQGRLDLLLAKTSIAGEPLRPSRLLLRCEDAELPERIRYLFGAAEAASATPAWQRAWKLQPPSVVPPPRIAVTAFRSWLDCPFRFFLSRVLRMEAVDPAKTELDVLDFGTLCHTALEAMARAPALRDCTEAEIIREFLLQELEAHATKRFGRDLTLPLVVQLESARQRLSRAADIHAASRAEGWVVVDVERKFELEIEGLTVVGKIDRIDRHEKTGAIRVLDYKTSDKPADPWDAHLRQVRREEPAPEFARLVHEGKEGVWVDLQLPLYLRAVRGMAAEWGEGAASVEAGYFNLPKAATETGIRPWDNYTRELDEAAWCCATGIAAAIKAGKFWPPNEKIRPERDDFAALFHHGVEPSVAWKGRSP